MIPGTIWQFVPLLFGVFAAQPGVIEPSVTRLVGQNQMVLRVPILPRPMVTKIDWQERKGPKCFPASLIRRAILSGEDQVDFILAGHGRVRAKLDEDCPALDFYGGFYLRPEDQRLCADRDAIYSRIGKSCTIEKFKQLVPKLPR
jgi:hypothetical protein